MSLPTDISLPDEMQAVVCHGPEDYRLQTWRVPQPGPGEVLIRVKSVGICASDVKVFHGSKGSWGDGEHPGYVQPPVIPGHEFVGEVVLLGDGAGEKYGLEIGDMAVSEQIVPCWNCRFCKSGQYWMCQHKHDVYGFRQRTFGAMAEYMLFPRDAINYKVPKSIPAHHAAFIEPLACAIHATQRGSVEFQDVVVVAGVGPIGLGMVAAIKRKSPQLLITVDFNDDRLEIARLCGADVVINPGKTDAIEEVLKLTDGYGCDVYFEATGHPSAVEQGLKMTRKLGRFVEFSVMAQPVTTDWTVIGDVKELDVRGAHLGPYCYPVAISWLENGYLPMDKIVTHRLPLEDYLHGFEMVSSAKESIKVTLTP